MNAPGPAPTDGPDGAPRPPGEPARDVRLTWTHHPATRAVVARARDGGEIGELALVLRSVGIPHQRRRLRGEHLLLVPAGDALRAEQHFAAYRSENLAQPEPAVSLPRLSGRAPWIALGWVALLGVFFQVQESRGDDWTAAGRNDAVAVRAGEWWRSVTALSLHADAGHLAGNAGLGALLLALIAPTFGAGGALAATLFAGSVGNLLNAVLRPEHRSLGASTAVFAALGLLVAVSWAHARTSQRRWLRRTAPLAMGAALLGMFGTGGERTDIAAHLLGMLVGLGLGVALVPHAERLRRRVGLQWLLGLGSVALLLVSWKLALTVVG